MVKGIVKFYNEEKGYGFILGDDDEEYFVHVTNVTYGIVLEEHDRVDFDKEKNDRGFQAVNVQIV